MKEEKRNRIIHGTLVSKIDGWINSPMCDIHAHGIFAEYIHTKSRTSDLESITFSERRQDRTELGLDLASGDLAVVRLKYLHVRPHQTDQCGRHPLQLRHQGLVVTIEDIITCLALESGL